jgi:hypothetical protein
MWDLLCVGVSLRQVFTEHFGVPVAVVFSQVLHTSVAPGACTVG